MTTACVIVKLQPEQSKVLLEISYKTTFFILYFILLIWTFFFKMQMKNSKMKSITSILINQTSYLKYFKSSNIQYTNKECLSGLSGQGCVTLVYQPFEKFIIDCLAKSTNGKINLIFVPSLNDKLITHFDFGFQQISI